MLFFRACAVPVQEFHEIDWTVFDGYEADLPAKPTWQYHYHNLLTDDESELWWVELPHAAARRMYYWNELTHQVPVPWCVGEGRRVVVEGGRIVTLPPCLTSSLPVSQNIVLSDFSFPFDAP